jgi:hypothetical protein
MSAITVRALDLSIAAPGVNRLWWHSMDQMRSITKGMGCHVLPMRNTIIAKSQDESV